MREIETRFANEVAVVGVHSGKFTSERETAHIRDAAIRLGAVHPTVNDRQFRIWRSYAVRAWPTVAAIDPGGFVVGMHAGEFTADALAPFVDRVIGEAKRAGSLDQRPLHFAADPPTREPGTLAFPGKVAVDGRRIAIADSSHHRVIVGTLDETGNTARIDRWYGDDGSLDYPQGLVFAGNTLYVADPGSHRVVAFDLTTGAVRTVSGTGRQARTQRDISNGAMSSPWDICLGNEVLYVAMAGLHQLWVVDLTTGKSVVHSGSGAEELRDGKHAEAALAQPMGLCLAGDAVCLTDSESSALRVADRDRGGGVHTIVGTGLFDFGDVDGIGEMVRLQHPQGIALARDGRLLVADTYNGSLKWVDRETRAVRTLARGLEEPSGVAITGDRAYVAETNRHRIGIVDLASGAVSELRLEG